MFNPIRIPGGIMVLVFTAGLRADDAGLLLRWPAHEGTGSLVRDTSGNRLDGQSAAAWTDVNGVKALHLDGQPASDSGEMTVYLNGMAAGSARLPAGRNGDFKLGNQLTIGAAWQDYHGAVAEAGNAAMAQMKTAEARTHFSRMLAPPRRAAGLGGLGGTADRPVPPVGGQRRGSQGNLREHREVRRLSSASAPGSR